MTTLELHDLVIVEKAKEDEVLCERAPFIKMNTNLAYLAWIIMKEKYNLDGALKITIHKVIPVSAGMAGGSADCAAAIDAINKLFKLNLSLDEMIQIGSQLGSDVPFCLVSQLAIATGRGEQIQALDDKLPKIHIVAIYPGFPLSTPQVYKNHIIEAKHQGDISKIVEATNFEDIVKNLGNDLEKTALKVEPRIASVFELINAEFENLPMMLSGSGPTVLVFCKDKIQQKAVFKVAKKKYNRTFFTTTRVKEDIS